MRKELKRFIIKILTAAAIMIAVGWAVFNFVFTDQYLPILPWMLLFFVLITIITHGYQIHLSEKNMALFIRTSMLISLVRLAIYSLFTIIYFANDSDNAAVFVVCIVTVYIVFSSIEVVNLARISRKNRRE